MAYLKIIWGFGAALLLSERKNLFMSDVSKACQQRINFHWGYIAGFNNLFRLYVEYVRYVRGLNSLYNYTYRFLIPKS